MQSLIYDIQRNVFFDLPNEYLSLLQEAITNDLTSLEKTFDTEADQLKAFFNRFVEAELGFYTVEPECFPEIDFTWQSAHNITNAILEFEKNSAYNFSDTIFQLSSLACKAIQLRLLETYSFQDITDFIKAFDKSRIKHIELLLPFNQAVSHPEAYKLMQMEPRLNSVLFYACPEEKVLLNENGGRKIVIQFKKDIRVDKEEAVSLSRFTTNISLFSEAQSYNVGLNRKVCIDRHGEIRNYITHNRSYGNIKYVSIADVIKHEEFTSKWGAANDKIEVCKECQYRYACVSNSDVITVDDKLYKAQYCDPLLSVGSELV